MRQTSARWARVTLVAGALLGAFPSAARAADPKLAFDATPLLGASATEDGGWRSLLVRLENPTTQPLTGAVEVESRPGWARSGAELRTSVPFSLAPSARVSVEVPTHGFGGGSPGLRVFARDNQGNELGSTTISGLKPADALLLDLATPSRIAPLLRNLSFASRRSTTYGTPIRAATVGVAQATEDATTGDLRLPELPAGYNQATLVVGSGRDLSRLNDKARAALADWLLSGGALALALDRPEDLTQPLLEAIAGGRITQSAAPEELRAVARFLVPSDDPAAPSTGVGALRLREVRLAPSPELAKRFVGYAGGNLRTTAWGSAASYGLGELHLLAFDPREGANLRDPWARHKLLDLARHAFDREPQALVRHSTVGSAETNLEQVRRELDPNQTSRWTIVVSALALLIYAVVAGPLSFYLAARKGRPLRALWHLPLWSAATFLLIVLFGVLGKGVSGRARKLSLFDMGAGMTRASALRFRGFYAPSSRELVVRALRREHLLDVTGVSNDIARTLLLDRDGPRLEGLRTKPWQTVLVREEGFVDFAGGVSIVPSEETFFIKNRSGHDLIGVMARQPSGVTTYFRRIKDGASVRAADGQALSAIGGHSSPGALDAGRFEAQLDADFPGLGRCWVAMERALTNDSEWWPSDAPAVLAALDGGEGKLTDSGLRIDYDRALVRVIGVGGKP